MNPLISFVFNGYKRQFTKNDFWDIEDSDSSRICTNRLEREWNKALNEYTSKRNSANSVDANTKFVKYAFNFN